MADQEQLSLLKRDQAMWNWWRLKNPERQPDLSGADLYGLDLHAADLSGANLSKASLISAYLYEANLTGADLKGASLSQANLTGANLSGANLSEANLGGAILVKANLTRATLTHCSIYGIAAWNIELEEATQDSLVITPPDEPAITVDNLKVAQFIYLLLTNAEIREVIETITSKVVLILGRFTPERKAVLDALRNELRKRNYSPVLFDFAGSGNRDVTETISLLAHMARFVLADITDARSIPQELSVIVPDLPSVPVQPLLLASASEYGMFEHFTRYPWVLPTFRYTDTSALLAALQERVIDPAERMAREGTRR
jgi:pentapeptide repeat protein